jgi:hypothetical protein
MNGLTSNSSTFTMTFFPLIRPSRVCHCAAMSMFQKGDYIIVGFFNVGSTFRTFRTFAHFGCLALEKVESVLWSPIKRLVRLIMQ